MKQAIVVGTYKHSPWREQCLKSLPSCYPVIAICDGDYEVAALRSILRYTTLDRWLFLQDSTMVKDPTWIAEHWTEDTSVGLLAEPNVYGSFLGWWKRSVLEQIALPDAPDKISAVLAEMSVPKAYSAIEPVTTLWPKLNIHDAVPELMFAGTPHERMTYRYENEYFVKWKSSTCGGSAVAAQERDDRIRQLYP